MNTPKHTNDSDYASALRIARNARDDALLHGNFLTYLRAERKYNKVKGKSSLRASLKKRAVKWGLMKSHAAVACEPGFIEVALLRCDTRSFLLVDENESLHSALWRYGIPSTMTWATCGTKVVRYDVPLREYLCESHTINMHPRMCGGSSVDLSGWLTEPAGGHCVPPTLQMLLPKKKNRVRAQNITHDAVELVRTIRKNDHDELARKMRHRGRAEIQADTSVPFFTIVDEEESLCLDTITVVVQANNQEEHDVDGVVEAIAAIQNMVEPNVVKLLEDNLYLAVGLFRARNWGDVAYAVVGYLKLRVDKDLLSVTSQDLLRVVKQYMDTPDIQDLDDTLQNVRNFRSFIGKWETIKESSYGKKFSKVLKYLTTFGLFSMFGVKPEAKVMKIAEDHSTSAWTKMGFLGALIDFVSLTVERVIVFAKTGDWDTFLHGEVTYQAWYDEVQRLKRLALGLGNLEALGTTFHAYVGDLKEALEQGRSIVKFSAAVGLEKKIAQNLMNDLETLNCSILSKKAAQQERRAPFGLLVFGGSGVAKSTFTRMLFLHFGKLRGLPIDDEYRYVRNAADDFWSGFNSQQWCIQMDDIGYLSTSKAQEDRSLMEIIQVVNNVPLVPNQADLSDKGKTPLRAELVVATSNAKDMNAPGYFHCPLAVQRRLPWVVSVTPKVAYARADAPEMMDPLKIPAHTDCYPDIWNILVERVVPAGEGANKRQMARHEKVASFTNVERFLDWFKETIFTFDQIQRKVVTDDEAMKHFVLCNTCSRVENRCICPKSSGPVKMCVPEIQAGRSVMFPINHKHKTQWTNLVPRDKKTYHYDWSRSNDGYVCTEKCWVSGKRRSYAVDASYPVAVQNLEELPVLTTYETVAIAEEGMRAASKGWLGMAIHFGLSSYLRYPFIQKAVTEVENLLEYSIQAGVVVTIPEGLNPGDSWTTQHEDAQCDYTWARGDLYRTTYPRDGRSPFTSCVEWTRLPRPQIQESHIDMAAMIEESIRCSCTTDPEGTYVLGKLLIGSLSLYHRYPWFRSVAHYALSFRAVRYVGSWFVDYVSRGSPLLRKIYVGVASVQEHMVKYGLAYKILAGLAVAAGIWKGVRWLLERNETEAEGPNFCDVPEWRDVHNTGVRPCANRERCEMREDMEIQGQRASVDASHFKRSERENVWKRDNYETTTFDVTPEQGNYAALTPEQVQKAIDRNVVRVAVERFEVPGITRGHALCVGGHLWVTCKHFFKGDADKYSVELKFENVSEGCNRNLNVHLFRKDMWFHPIKDQVWFELRGVEVKKDITKLISKPTLDGVYDGFLVAQKVTTEPAPNRARAMVKVEFVDPKDNHLRMFWRGYMSSNTEYGDCGAPLVAHKPITSIVGLHYMGGYSNYAFSTPLNTDDLAMARERFSRPLIQSSEPSLSTPTVHKILGALHHKSPLRWLEKGTLNVYGTFQGAHLKPRSRVRQTLLSDRIMNERGWTLDVGAPELGDWRPWRHAYLDTCNQEHIVSQADIDACVKAYVADVTQRLDAEALHNLQRLNTYDAINGIAGVKYIDKMNFNSSMGEPYNHSKKYHLRSQPSDTAPEGKMFDDEVMARIANLRTTYESGKRGCSVFSGQQKDEARSLKKLSEGMIRIFTACSTELSVVVRELLLPFVKVFQENPLIFEGAPGAVCQSREWTRFRAYLTQFGLDRLIAGDYGKFDKKMLAEWILAAFEVIVRILMFAGWTDEECLPIWALAEDIAFPVVNMNGDLVMFFGSNPSGHPLTVIVNCIVNALYMRYCYMKLSPVGSYECLHFFKKDVALLTYGDDNAAGSRVSWFNHTAIVAVLKSIGVVYTMADKESKSVPFIHIDQVSFLKRMWVWNAEANAFFCPLEEASIRKMLLIAMRSKTVSDEQHMSDVIRAAHQEWFWYGRERFEKETEYLTTLTRGELSIYFEERPLPTWEDLMARFHRASVGVEDFYVGELVELPEI